MEYLNDSQAQYADELVEKFKENVFSCWFDNLSDHNKRNLAILLNNQMRHLSKLTSAQMGGLKASDVLDFTCQEFKKLIAVYPENVFALPASIVEFQYYNKEGEKTALQVESSLKERDEKADLASTLQNYFEKNFYLKHKKEDFKIFPLLLWVSPANKNKDKPQEYWYGDTMIVPEGEPKKETGE